MSTFNWVFYWETFKEMKEKGQAAKNLLYEYSTSSTVG